MLDSCCLDFVVLIWINTASGRVMICALRQEIKGRAMEIEGTKFGSITIDRTTYEHDVVIRLSGEVIKRKKKLSKRYYGTSHVLSKDEAKFVFEKDASNSLLARGKWAMCIYRPKPKPILQKRAARSYCSLPPRRSVRSTNHKQRRLGFFTSPVENNKTFFHLHRIKIAREELHGHSRAFPHQGGGGGVLLSLFGVGGIRRCRG